MSATVEADLRWRRHLAFLTSDPRAFVTWVVLLLAHSLVDYPLRTAAMMAVIAFAFALMIEPVKAATREAARSAHAGHGPSAATALSPVPAAAPALPRLSQSMVVAPPSPPKIAKRWGEGVAWPDAWRKPAAGANGKKPSPADKPENK